MDCWAVLRAPNNGTSTNKSTRSNGHMECVPKWHLRSIGRFVVVVLNRVLSNLHGICKNTEIEFVMSQKRVRLAGLKGGAPGSANAVLVGSVSCERGCRPRTGP